MGETMQNPFNTGISRRAVMYGSAALLSTAGIARAADSAASVSVVDTVSGPNFQDFWKSVIIPEVKAKTGVSVSYTVGAGPALQLQMQSWRQNEPGFTLLFLKDLDLANMVSAGIKLTKLYPTEAAAIPNESQEAKSFLASENGVPLKGEGLIFWRAQFDLIYNSQFIKSPPKTWKEFFDRRQEFKGHIGMIRPDAGSGGGRAFIYSFLTAFGVDFSKPMAELQNSPAWKKAWATFTEFSKFFAQPVASSPPVMFHQFQTEQAWISSYAQDYTLWSAAQGQLPPTMKAAPLDVNIVGASNAWLAVPEVASAAQKAAAYKVINVLLSDQLQLKMLEAMYQYPGTEAWKKAPASAWAKIPTVEQAESHGIRMNNFDALTYIQKHGMEFMAS